MRTYVSTLGYHSTRVTRPVLGNGVDRGDRIVVLRPAEDKDEDGRAEQAVDDIRQMTQQIEPEVIVDVAQLPATDFAVTVREALAVLSDAEGEVIATFGGGPREIFLPFTVAVLVRRDLIDDALQFSDMDGSVRDIPVPDLLTPIPESAEPTLGLIDDLGGETTLPKLAEASDKAKSTIVRHLDKLEAVDAIETNTEGQTRLVGLTLSGELRLDFQADHRPS